MKNKVEQIKQEIVKSCFDPSKTISETDLVLSLSVLEGAIEDSCIQAVRNFNIQDVAIKTGEKLPENINLLEYIEKAIKLRSIKGVNNE